MKQARLFDFFKGPKKKKKSRVQFVDEKEKKKRKKKLTLKPKKTKRPNIQSSKIHIFPRGSRSKVKVKRARGSIVYKNQGQPLRLFLKRKQLSISPEHQHQVRVP